MAFAAGKQRRRRMSSLTCMAYNSGDRDIDLFETGIVKGSKYEENDPSFYTDVLLEIGDAGETDAQTSFVIAAGLIPSGECGVVYVMGVCPAWVNGSDRFGACVEGAGHLSTHDWRGTAEILWVASGSGVREALIRFPVWTHPVWVPYDGV